jgi:hypothetical protein
MNIGPFAKFPIRVIHLEIQTFCGALAKFEDGAGFLSTSILVATWLLEINLEECSLLESRKPSFPDVKLESLRARA